MIISNDVIKGSLIAYLKGVTEVTDYLDDLGSSVDEIREVSWKGREFVYPNIRLRIVRNIPDSGCNSAQITAAWLVFTEAQSSATADELSGIIASYFQGKQFSVTLTLNGSSSEYSISLSRVTLMPAISLGELTWRSEVIIEGWISKIS